MHTECRTNINGMSSQYLEILDPYKWNVGIILYTFLTDINGMS